MNLKNYKCKIKPFIIFYFLIFYYLLFNLLNKKEYEIIKDKRKKIGIIGFPSGPNPGNNLLKYSMFIILKNYGFKPTLISLKTKRNIFFLRKYLYLKEISNYSRDLKEYDFDILIVNSDQIWSYLYPGLLEVGFLSFAQNWNISKFVYAASLGHDCWKVSKKTLQSARKLVKQFSGISVREPGSVKIIKKYLGIEPFFVLDPTLLLDKKEYLKLTKNFKSNTDLTKNYLCKYILDETHVISDYIEKASKALKYFILNITLDGNDYIEKFIFSINICRAVITDSFHGTIFSIIFSKPFLTFINSNRGKARFVGLNQTFELYNRIMFPKNFNEGDLYILRNNPIINQTKFQIQKEKSIIFLKKNLGMKD